MTCGCMGKMLFVDLTEGKIDEETTAEKLYRDFLGGYGIGARILFSRQKARIDPLGADAMLGFVSGILTGTPALFGSRYTVVGKSPLTGTWGDANCGGDFGPHLKFAGYDAVFFSGISAAPVYLFIDNGTAELREASELWGKDTWETESLLQTALGKEARVACIGPAAEKMSLISCIINNRGRAAGRSGLGAVMGSKKLKAIVVRGDQEVPIAHEAELKAARKKHLEQLGGTVEVYRQFGTCGAMNQFVQIGDAPIKNWRGSAVDFPNATVISDQSVINLQERKYGCWRCPVACGGHMKPGSGEYQYPAGVHKPEYETLAAFGSMCLNDNLESIIKVNDICNRYGLDTISVGAVIAVAVEAYEKGLLTATEAGGLDLSWGNGETLIQLVEQIGRKKGLGARLGEGSVRFAAELGPEAAEFVIAVKGLEIPMHDPRGFVSMAANYATANRGGCHLEALSYWNGYGVAFPELGYPEALDRFSNEIGGKMAYDFQNYMSVFNALGLCKFIAKAGVEPETVIGYLNHAMGWQWTSDDLLRMGEKLFNLKRMINVRYGIGRKDDTLPPRLVTLARPSGSAEGVLPDMDRLLSDYYELRGWNPDGSPSEERLAELGLA